VSKKVKLRPYFDINPRTLCYNKALPAVEIRERAFSGIASFDCVDESRGITKDCSLTVGIFDRDCDADFDDLIILIGNWLERA
jgi:hypothetical protein